MTFFGKLGLLSALLTVSVSSYCVRLHNPLPRDTLINDTERLDYDFIPNYHSYDLVADRLSCLEESIPLNYNTRVYSFINYFAIRDRDYTRDVISRTEYFFPIFEEYLRKYGLPQELKYLSIVESGLNARAISRAGAGGLWQFMPYTGRSYGLHQDFYIDERFDPYKATEAACKYMKMLYNMFGDWELALAAYNSGPGNVRKAIRRSGYKKNFWEIYRYLPRETRSYVPQFVAVLYVFNYADEYNLNTDQKLYTIEYDTLMVDKFINLKLLAKELNICYEDLDLLNPAVKRFALPETTKRYPIRIPEDKSLYVSENRSSILANSAASGQKELMQLSRNTPGSTYGRDRIVYRVRSGDVLGKIAERYYVRVSDLKKWNNLHGSLIRIGQRLNIWVLPSRNLTYTGTEKVSANQSVGDGVGNSTVKSDLINGKYHVVQPGDTLWDISRKYDGLSIEKLKKMNNLKSNKITPGQKLLIG